jgi:hypothetical protein
MSHPSSSEDPFSHLLTLEDTLYTTAYDLGAQAGARAGRIEGRIFGLEKGFEKFAMMGELHGRACVWGARLPGLLNSGKKRDGGEVGEVGEVGQDVGEVGRFIVVEKDDDEPQKEVGEAIAKSQGKETHTTPHAAPNEPSILPHLPPTARLTTHISLLHGLTDPLTFSTLNEEEAVADYDDRFKRASAKAKMIERIVREKDGVEGEKEKGGASSKGSHSMKVMKEKKEEGNIEDFTGSRLLS